MVNSTKKDRKTFKIVTWYVKVYILPIFYAFLSSLNSFPTSLRRLYESYTENRIMLSNTFIILVPFYPKFLKFVHFSQSVRDTLLGHVQWQPRCAVARHHLMPHNTG